MASTNNKQDLPADGKTHLANQLLRLRIINGRFANLKDNVSSYAVVSIGKQSARTKVVKNSNTPVYEENFAIGYELEDLQSEIVIDVFEKGLIHDDRIGEFRLRLAQIDPPKERKARSNANNQNNAAANDNQTANATGSAPTTAPSGVTGAGVAGATPGAGGTPAAGTTTGTTAVPSGTNTTTGNQQESTLPLPTAPIAAKKADSWAKAQPHEAVLLDRKGTNVGVLSILVRREIRLHGALRLHVGELDLSPSLQNSAGIANNAPTQLNIKLGETRNESETVNPSGNIVPFNYDVNFQVNDSNNISDIFFELWQGGKALAEGRLPLYDTRKGYNGTVTFIGPFGGHDITDINNKFNVAVLNVSSTIN